MQSRNGGKGVSNGIEGFVSGVAHPLIGVDHLAMIIAIGVLARRKLRPLRGGNLCDSGNVWNSAFICFGLSLPLSGPLVSSPCWPPAF